MSGCGQGNVSASSFLMNQGMVLNYNPRLGIFVNTNFDPVCYGPGNGQGAHT